MCSIVRKMVFLHGVAGRGEARTSVLRPRWIGAVSSPSIVAVSRPWIPHRPSTSRVSCSAPWEEEVAPGPDGEFSRSSRTTCTPCCFAGLVEHDANGCEGEGAYPQPIHGDPVRSSTLGNVSRLFSPASSRRQRPAPPSRLLVRRANAAGIAKHSSAPRSRRRHKTCQTRPSLTSVSRSAAQRSRIDSGRWRGYHISVSYGVGGRAGCRAPSTHALLGPPSRIARGQKQLTR